MKDNNLLYQNIGDELNLGMLLYSKRIQTLWSGYGELVRLNFLKKSIIVKHIKLPKVSNHPHGWNTNFSHKRKLHSYKVEVNWYKGFTKVVDARCRMPQGLKTFQTNNEWLIVMEDLAAVGFGTIVTEAKKTHLKSCLSWLANFHARFLGLQSDLVWEVGTYWHLDTRPDEFEVLEDIELKKFAKLIDSKLKNCQYQTIVHGDAKLANFCFNDDGTQCAAVDFQYVGHGCAMKDVVYFMSSAVKPKDCTRMQEWILDCYFEALHEALKFYQTNVDSMQVEKEWRALFSIAWADFQRFIKGWNPNHYKINSYSNALTQEVLSSFNSKKHFKKKSYNV